MKKKYLISLLVISVFFTGCKSGRQDVAGTSDNTIQTEENQALSGKAGIVHQTIMQVDTMKMTGDPDYDFARIMLAHHRGGLALVQDELQNGSDSVVQDLAIKIKEDQENDLIELQSFTAKNKPGEPDEDFLEEVKKHIEKAREDMEANLDGNENSDADFVTLMSMHHKNGQDMAELAIKHAKNEEIKKIAQKMAQKQEQQLKELEELKD